MATSAWPLGADQRDDLDADGYVLLRGVVDPDLCAAAAAGLADSDADADTDAAPAAVARGDTLTSGSPGMPGVVDAVRTVLGEGATVVRLGAVVIRPGTPGPAWRRPAHGGGRLALTDATLAGGCPWVVPGSHTRAAGRHDDVDPHPGVGSVPVPMAPGDLLLHVPRLLHRTTDNHAVAPHVALLYRVSGPRSVG
jgi:hypothetical protein